MKRLIAIFVLTMLLIASVVLHEYSEEHRVDLQLLAAGRDAAWISSALQKLRNGETDQGIASLERLALMRLETAARRRETVSRDVNL